MAKLNLQKYQRALIHSFKIYLQEESLEEFLAKKVIELNCDANDLLEVD